MNRVLMRVHRGSFRSPRPLIELRASPTEMDIQWTLHSRKRDASGHISVIGTNHVGMGVVDEISRLSDR